MLKIKKLNKSVLYSINELIEKHLFTQNEVVFMLTNNTLVEFDNFFFSINSSL